MATSLIDICDLFLSKIDDYRLNALYQQDVTAFNTYLEVFLISAINDFSICTQDLTTYSKSSQEFSITLTDQHKLILAELMKKHWLKKEVFNVLQMNNFVLDRDFKTHSAAQNLKEKRALLNSVEEDTSQMIQDYAYANNSWENWKDQDFD